MRFNLFTCLVLLCVLSAVPAYSKVETFTGQEWGWMSHQEKFNCVLAAIVWMDACRVPLSNSPNAYIAKIDELLSIDSHLKDEDLTSIFASIVYRNEPQSRQALKALKS